MIKPEIETSAIKKASIPINSITIELPDITNNAKTYLFIPAEKTQPDILFLPSNSQKSNNLSNSINHELPKSIPGFLIAFADPSSNNRGEQFLLHSSPTPKCNSTLLDGDGATRPCTNLQGPSGGSRSDYSDIESNFPSPSSVRRDETSDGDLQQPAIVVDGPLSPTELSFSPDSILPLYDMGDATVQPFEPSNDPRKPQFPTFLFPSTGTRGSVLLVDRPNADSGDSSCPHHSDPHQYGGEPKHIHPQQHSIILTGTNPDSNPLPNPLISKHRGKHKYSGNRRCVRTNEKNVNGNNGPRGSQNDDFQRAIKKMPPYLSAESTKMISRYKNFLQPRNRELCCNNEPNFEEWESIKLGRSPTNDKPTKPE
ncbi:hypothetical protein HAX54_038656 [Datura stramonium]|uniref:Uncharacterized protein n=1 Tax=Datura stramonium TaxID=4076 RepID=A0ABS8SI75_DATST|nr:hypothetical protein [Datura stramonium]